MPAASKGLGHFASGVRSLHVYAHAPRQGVGVAHPHPPRPPTATTAGRIYQTTKTALTRFLAHVTAPGFTHPVAWGSSARNLSTRVNATVRPPTIQQGLSLPARHALGRPRAGPPFMPRATPASRNVMQVGLGTARNFSTARPLFQQFAANVPVAGRAIYEADWDLEKRIMKGKVRSDLKGKASEKENVTVQLGSSIRTKPAEKPKAKDFERYFPVDESVVSEVTTVLLVPLAPTPTSRLPLIETSSAITEAPLLVVSDLQDVLSSHRIHSLRVSSLFARLDACEVWGKGVRFSACGDASGLCTVLRVEFKGWTEEMVRGVMGDAGRGWCRVVEIRPDEGEEESRSVREGSLRTPSVGSTTPEHDPSTSMVLPTLDFSASFHATCASVDSRSISTPVSPPMSPPGSPPVSNMSSPLLSVSELIYSPSSDFDMDMDMHTDMHTDMHSDMDIVYDFDSDAQTEWSFGDGSGSDSGSGSLISFSSDFLQRSANV